MLVSAVTAFMAETVESSPSKSVTGASSALRTNNNSNMEVEFRARKKMSKFDSLKPLLNLLETCLIQHGMTQHQADLVVLDIAERLEILNANISVCAMRSFKPKKKLLKGYTRTDGHSALFIYTYIYK